VEAVRTGAPVCLAASAWVFLAHDLVDLPPGAAAAFIALTTAAAFGIGYETGDGGAAAALFLVLAGVGLVFVAQTRAFAVLLFATLPALIAAPSALAGGSLRERKAVET
jgi:hypothetical protein